jgi:hypothetical protein
MIDHDGTRTHNLPLRRRAPYPLGHAVTLVYKTYYSIINHLSSNWASLRKNPRPTILCALLSGRIAANRLSPLVAGHGLARFNLVLPFARWPRIYSQGSSKRWWVTCYRHEPRATTVVEFDQIWPLNCKPPKRTPKKKCPLNNSETLGRMRSSRKRLAVCLTPYAAPNQKSPATEDSKKQTWKREGRLICATSIWLIRNC